MGKVLLRVICAVALGAIGVAGGYFGGVAANEFMDESFFLTRGLWNLEQGAPPLVLQIVEILPAAIGGLAGVISGLLLNSRGILVSLLAFPLAYVIAILDGITCFILAFFVTGSWLPALVLFAVLAELIGGVGGVFYIFILKR